MMALLIMIIFLYIWIFVVKKNVDLLGLEHVDIESYLVEDASDEVMLKFYNKTNATKPYINIAYNYTTTPIGLDFKIKNPEGNIVSYKTLTMKENNNYKELRIYFNNTKSKYYTVRYNLTDDATNANNIEIVRLELKV
jgi:hypothetical protein